MSNWWVVQTEANFEHVARLLLMRLGFVTYAPRIKVRGRVAWLFPAYLFVGAREQFYPILWTNRVVRLLMAGDRPAQLPEDVVTNIRKREHNGFVKLPNVSRQLKKGQKVRVIRGSFEGQIGLYEGMSGKDRERVLLELLGQVVPVELPGKDIAPLNVERLQDEANRYSSLSPHQAKSHVSREIPAEVGDFRRAARFR
jgi:transcriptional antiterminator RfaH